ncbi:MAG: FecR domain-containing protein [Gammaproteobacteria bacterium]
MTVPIKDEPTADCIEQAGAWCVRLAEGSLTPAVRAEFDGWLAADPENRRAFDDVARTWQSLEQTHLSPDLVAMRRDALNNFRKAHAAQWNRSTRRRLFSALAAALVIVVIGAALWVQHMPRSYETGTGERSVVALSDGSRISLDTKTRVEVHYTSQRRELRLISGRAKFQVAKNSLRPFSVTAADKVVVATGTEFSVELLSKQVHVILYQGRVEVLAERSERLQPVRIVPQAAASGTAKPADAGVLLPGRELIAPLEATDAQVSVIDIARSLMWESGQLTFNDEPLAAAVERVNRYIDTPLVVGDAAAADIRISGTFSAGDTASFVEGVTGVFPVRVTEIDGRKTLVSARP